ncbi:hypothetical protein NMG60_11001676 [Bertholletia excelsa]
MAGLQYNFFPTDFFFPPQKSLAKDAAHPQVLPIKAGNTEDQEPHKSLILRGDVNDRRLKALPSSSTPIAPVTKQD